MAQVTESDYIAAQKGDAKVRNDFVNDISLGDARGLITQREYFPKRDIDHMYGGKKKEVETLMALTYTFKYLKGISSITDTFLEIFPKAFTYSFSSFMNCVLHHELHHSRQLHQKGFSSYVQMTDKSPRLDSYGEVIIEIPAFLNQLTTLGDFPLGAKEVLEIHDDLFILDNLMKTQARKIKRDWKKDLSMILCFSPYDDIVRERYGID